MKIKHIIEDVRAVYKTLLPVYCPYIDSNVTFTSSGLQHIIWKSEMSMRPTKVIAERTEALSVVRSILENSGTLQEYENLIKEYLCFIAILDSKKYKVVIQKKKDGTYKFVSVIPKWKTGKRDK